MLFIMLPVCIATGFGQRSLVSYLVGVSGIGFVLGTALYGIPMKQGSQQLIIQVVMNFLQ